MIASRCAYSAETPYVMQLLLARQGQIVQASHTHTKEFVGVMMSDVTSELLLSCMRYHRQGEGYTELQMSISICSEGFALL